MQKIDKISLNRSAVSIACVVILEAVPFNSVCHLLTKIPTKSNVYRLISNRDVKPEALTKRQHETF